MEAAIPSAGLPPHFPEPFDDDIEPSEEAIEADWPTYLALVDAECRFLTSPDVLARRALRRADITLARALAERANADDSARSQSEYVQGVIQ